MFRFLKWIFIDSCPNCESAWTGGHPNPYSITKCIVCDNPRTGEMRGWCWRWGWLSRRNVYLNFKRYRRRDV